MNEVSRMNEFLTDEECIFLYYAILGIVVEGIMTKFQSVDGIFSLN